MSKAKPTVFAIFCAIVLSISAGRFIETAQTVNLPDVDGYSMHSGKMLLVDGSRRYVHDDDCPACNDH